MPDNMRVNPNAQEIFLETGARHSPDNLSKMPKDYIRALPFRADTNQFDLGYIDAALDPFAKVKIDDAAKVALENLKQSIRSNELSENTELSDFLNPARISAETYPEDYKALRDEYIALQEPIGKSRIENYTKNLATKSSSIDLKFNRFLEEEKKRFYKAYPTAELPDEKKREALWEMYAKSLKENIQEPHIRFRGSMANLGQQRLIHLANQLAKKIGEDEPLVTLKRGVPNEELKKQVQYKNSKGEPITAEYNNDGTVKKLHVSKNIADAFDILAASHGDDVRIKVEIPPELNLITAFEGNQSLFVLLILVLVLYLVQRNKEGKIIQNVLDAVAEKGMSLENLHIVRKDTGAPFHIPQKLIEKALKAREKLEQTLIAQRDLTYKGNSTDSSSKESEKHMVTVAAPAA